MGEHAAGRPRDDAAEARLPWMPTTHNLDDHVAVPDVPARTRVQQVEVVEDDGASRDEEQRFVGVTGVGPEGECRLDARGVGDSHHVDAIVRKKPTFLGICLIDRK